LKKFDLVGTAVFIPAVLSLILSLQWGGSKYPWSDKRIVGLLAAFVVLIAIFIAVQIFKGEDATLPPRIICQRSIAAGALFSVCLGAAFFMLVFYVSTPSHSKSCSLENCCSMVGISPVVSLTLRSCHFGTKPFEVKQPYSLE
jgi:hypothetical protein